MSDTGPVIEVSMKEALAEVRDELRDMRKEVRDDLKEMSRANTAADLAFSDKLETINRRVLALEMCSATSEAVADNKRETKKLTFAVLLAILGAIGNIVLTVLIKR